jgi:hypothetical protein
MEVTPVVAPARLRRGFFIQASFSSRILFTPGRRFDMNVAGRKMASGGIQADE